MSTKACAVILAGGEGKRMKSDKPKVLSEVLFRPMLRWVIEAVREAHITDICVVTGHKREYVEDYLKIIKQELKEKYKLTEEQAAKEFEEIYKANLVEPDEDLGIHLDDPIWALPYLIGNECRLFALFAGSNLSEDQVRARDRIIHEMDKAGISFNGFTIRN